MTPGRNKKALSLAAKRKVKDSEAKQRLSPGTTTPKARRNDSCHTPLELYLNFCLLPPASELELPRRQDLDIFTILPLNHLPKRTG